MSKFHIGYLENGQHCSHWINAVSAKQALYKLTKALPSLGYLWGWYNSGDSRLEIKNEGPLFQQMSLF